VELLARVPIMKWVIGGGGSADTALAVDCPHANHEGGVLVGGGGGEVFNTLKACRLAYLLRTETAY
jgi:hypothetical protein